jgi:hypothetical protein
MEAAAVVTDIAGVRLRQHRQGSIVTMNSLGGEDVHIDQLIEWPRPPGGARQTPHPDARHPLEQSRLTSRARLHFDRWAAGCTQSAPSTSESSVRILIVPPSAQPRPQEDDRAWSAT